MRFRDANGRGFRVWGLSTHSPGVEHELATLARDQEGLLTIRNLAAHGISRRRRQRLVADGRLRPVAPGVYAAAGVPETHRYRLRLGLLWLGEPSWIAFEAAAALHGLDRSQPDAVEFCVPRGRRRSSRFPYPVHTTKFIRAIDLVVVNGMRVTSATRTVLDLALARANRWRVEAAIDSAVRLGLSSPETLARRLADVRGSGRWGCRLIDRLLVDSGGHTMLERRFLELVREAGLPRPRTQVVHRKDGRHVARVDFLFDHADVVVEVSGRLGHSSPSDRARDAQRRNELQDLGARVFEYTWEDVTNRSPMVVRTLRTRLAERPDRPDHPVRPDDPDRPDHPDRPDAA